MRERAYCLKGVFNEKYVRSLMLMSCWLYSYGAGLPQSAALNFVAAWALLAVLSVLRRASLVWAVFDHYYEMRGRYSGKTR